MRPIRFETRARALLTTLLAAALGLAVPVSAAAQQGAVAGRVTEETGTRGIEGAQVFITGTSLGALTDAQGRYRIERVPAGSVEVQVRYIGYQTAVRTVTVTAGQTTTADFTLAVQALGVDELVVTAVGDQRRRELGNAVAAINGDIVEEAPITEFSDLITGRAAGVQVLPSGGTTGAGGRVRIRGSSSVSLGNEPLIYVDGARISSDAADFFQDLTGGQAPSRLEDINPEDIESIEIVRGPSAATLYGTEAANGVIRITTRRGGEGQTRWRLWAEGGVLEDANDYPANYQGLDANGDPCDLLSVAAGDCTQATIASRNLLRDSDTSPLGTGVRQQYGGNVSGGVGGVTYFLSGEWENEDGVLPQNDLEKVNLRANFGAVPRDNLSFNVSTGYVTSNGRLPQNDNNTLGFHLNGLLGGTEPDSWFAFTPEELDAISVEQDLERFTGSASTSWDPFPWLNLRGSGGLDVANREDTNFFPTGSIQAFGLETGLRVADRFQTRNYTVDIAANADVDLKSWLSSQTSVGLQYFQETLEGTSSQGEDLPAGSNSIATAAITESTEETTESRTLGLFVQQQFSFNDRLFLTGAVRGDDNSAFGRDFDIVIYPKLSVSWVISEEAFFPRADWVNSVRLRGAWGQSGNQPGVTDAVRFVRGVAATAPDGADVIGVTFIPTPGQLADAGGLGNPDLEPERSSELEVGVDADLLDRRLGLELTLYDKRTRDALVFRNLAPSLGAVTGRFENIGDTRNRGIEAAISAVPVDSDVRWELGLSGSFNDNELETLGEGVEPFSFGFEQRHAPGFPLGAYWERPIESFEDADGNGILTASEVTVGDTLVFIDDAIPTREASFRTSATILDRVRLSGLLDYRGGHSLHNNTSEFRCRLGNAQERHDPSTPLETQAACIADAFGGTEYGYIEDASFLKLREVAVTLFAPETWARSFGASNLSLTLSGRNLFTWTGYSGVDPEVNTFGAAGVDTAGFGQSDFGTQPPVRYFTARLNVTF